MEKVKEKLLEIDKKVFFHLYYMAQRKSRLKGLMMILGKGAHYIFFAIYVLVGVFVLLEWKPDAVFDVSAVILMLGIKWDFRIVPYIVIPMFVLILNTKLRKVFRCERPFNEDENIENMIGHKESYSFPSNHAASAMVIATAVGFIEIKALVVLIPLAVMTGLSRVMTGVHYPKDVLVGWGIGALIGTIGFTAAKWLI